MVPWFVTVHAFRKDMDLLCSRRAWDDVRAALPWHSPHTPRSLPGQVAGVARSQIRSASPSPALQRTQRGASAGGWNPPLLVLAVLAQARGQNIDLKKRVQTISENPC